MKQCDQCNQDRKGLKRYMLAGFDGVIKNMRLCKDCKWVLEKHGFLYPIKKGAVNIATYIARAQADMKKKRAQEKEASKKGADLLKKFIKK